MKTLAVEEPRTLSRRGWVAIVSQRSEPPAGAAAGMMLAYGVADGVPGPEAVGGVRSGSEPVPSSG